jgi:transaldolase
MIRDYEMNLNVKLFADGADKNGMIEMSKNPIISGFTTNPTLMKAAGVSDYVAFAKDILSAIQDRPISFEVFSDDFGDMERQAIEISSWGSNVNVKIPITNTQGESSEMLIKKLTDRGIQQNVTAIMTAKQVESILPQLVDGPGGFVSVFAGRIADAGIDPLPIMKEVVYMLKDLPQIELIWASPRELYNVVQANDIGCDIITATSGILKKLNTLGKDLDVFSLETVKMFYDDAKNAGYQL